ncbi:MAG: hypothetical protein QXH09_06805 [Candidatus Bathyarchaeia archaeon]
MYVSKRNLQKSRCESEPIGLALAVIAIVLIAYTYWSIIEGFFESAILSLGGIGESLEVRYAYYVNEEVYMGESLDILLDGDLTLRLYLGAEYIHALEFNVIARSLSGYTRIKLYIYDYREGVWHRISEFTVDQYTRLYGPFRFYHASNNLYDGSIYMKFEISDGSVNLDRVYAIGYLRRSNIVRIGLYSLSQYKPVIVSRLWLYDPYTVSSIDERCIVRYGSISDLYVDTGSPYVYMVKVVTEDGGVYSRYLWRGVDELYNHI